MKQNRTTLIFTTIIFIASGLLLIYRGLQRIDNLHKFSGTVSNLTIQEFESGKSGYRYSLDFALGETEKVYGIYLGTKDQADKNELKNKIELGKTYTFYVDETVSPSADGHTLGIKSIENHGQIIYKESSKASYVGGSLFLTMGLGTLLILIYWDRRKKTPYNKSYKTYAVL